VEQLISVIVPTRNRPEQLQQCLNACLNLTEPGMEVEVIVVDDGSDEPAVAPEGVRLLRQQWRGPAVARNAGANVARGEYLAFIDDDCRPESGWLVGMVEELRQWPDALVGGLTKNGCRESIFSEASQTLVDYLYDFLQRHREETAFICSNNLVVRRESFLKAGGFNERFTSAAAEDRDLSERWMVKRYVSTAVVWHFHDLALWRFLRQQFQYGVGASQLDKLRQARMGEPPKQKGNFHLGLVCWPYSKYDFGKATVMASLLLLSQCAHAAGIVAGKAGFKL